MDKEIIYYYNQPNKKNFMETQTDAQNVRNHRIFSKLAPTERNLNKEVFEFTQKELTDFYAYLNCKTINILAATHSTVKAYCKWAATNGLCKYPRYLNNIRMDTLTGYLSKVARDKTIVDRDKVLEWIKELSTREVHNKRDEFIILALFEGINGKEFCELANLKISDLFKENKQYYVKLPDRTIPISDRLAYIIEELEETRLIYAKGRYGEVREYPVEEVSYLYKKKADKKIENESRDRISASIFNNIKSCFSYLGIEKIMSPKLLQLSGEIYQIKLSAREYGLTPVEYINTKNYLDREFTVFGNERKKNVITSHIFALKKRL